MTAPVIGYPLSPQQKALWPSMASGAFTWCAHGAAQVPVLPSGEVLERAILHVGRRHEALRTCFRTVSGLALPLQVVCDEPQVRLCERTLTPDQTSDAALEEVRREHLAMPWDLGSAPDLRCTVLRRVGGPALLAVTLPALCADAHSLRQFVSEVVDAASGRVSYKGADEPVQYAQYSQWAAGLLESADGEGPRTWWNDQLSPGAPTASIPFLRPGWEAGDPVLAVTAHGLDASLTDRLTMVSARSNVPLSALFLGAWFVVLRALNGAAVTSGFLSERAAAELTSCIGPMARVLTFGPARVEEDTFAEFCRDLHRRAAQFREWQEYRVPRATSPGATAEWGPLQFELQDLTDAPHLPLTWHRLSTAVDRSALKSIVRLAHGGAMLECHADTRSLTHWDIERLVDSYVAVLDQVASNPEVRILRIETRGVAERAVASRLRRFAPAAASHPVHELFEARARACPQATALVFEGESWTYAELNARANRLARKLRRLGIGPEAVVPILAERSADMVAAAVAVLKSGAAYAGLDCKCSNARLASIIDACASGVVLAQRHLADRLPAGVIPLWLDRDPAGVEADALDLPPVARPGNVAYVSFTSGSTGEPKGVTVEHGQLSNYCAAACALLQISEGTTLATVSTMANDLGYTVIFPALTSGGILHVLSEDVVLDAQAAAEYFERHPVDILKIVPSHLRVLLGTPANASLVPRRALVLGGESWTWQLFDAIRSLSPTCRLFNHYGPTETTVGVLACNLENGDARGHAAVPPLGFAIAAAQLHIVDDDLREVPIGVAGELCIAGPPLARGYLNQPGATAERYVPNPCSATPGARMYRSGDLVRMLPDGAVEFVGRTDGQIKVRGYRVETKEIEAVLAAHPAVADAVTLVERNGNGDATIVAYFAPQEEYIRAFKARARSEQIGEWQAVFDGTHGEPAMEAEGDGLCIGWNSSYTGLPIPEPEVREQVEATARRILNLRPSRMLEIGCGPGLLLAALAPNVREYWGIDFSEVVLNRARRLVERQGLRNVRLLRRDAQDVGDLDGAFDLVVLNSVVQYFPDVDYLIETIRGALTLLRPGGALWVGDVRNHNLGAAFHAGVQLARAGAEVTGRDLLNAVRRYAAHESELLVSPEFFFALATELRGVSAVDVALKEGDYRNELTKFRYDVIVTAGEIPSPSVAVDWRDWDSDRLTPPALLELADRARPAILAVGGIPNARVVGDCMLARWIERGEPVEESLDALRHHTAAREAAAVNPHELAMVCRRSGWSVDLRWCTAGAPDRFEVILRRRGAHSCNAAVPPRRPVSRRLPSHTSVPFHERLARTLGREVRSWLRSRLPDYMMPGACVMVHGLPLGSNGKVERRALQRLRWSDEERPEAVPPKTAVERVIAAVWADILGGTGPIGIYDDFFELGGHSLLATQVVSTLRSVFHASLPLRAFLEAPTVAGLSAALTAVENVPGEARRMAEILEEVAAGRSTGSRAADAEEL